MGPLSISIETRIDKWDLSTKILLIQFLVIASTSSNVFKLLHYNMWSPYPIWSYLPGNREGKIFVWELQSSPPVLIARLVGWLVLLVLVEVCVKESCNFCTIWMRFSYSLTSSRLTHAQSKSPIRQTAMSFEGRWSPHILVIAFDYVTIIYDLDNYCDCQNMQSPFLDVAAQFSAAVRMGLFGAGMLWQCLEPI